MQISSSGSGWTSLHFQVRRTTATTPTSNGQSEIDDAGTGSPVTAAKARRWPPRRLTIWTEGDDQSELGANEYCWRTAYDDVERLTANPNRRVFGCWRLAVRLRVSSSASKILFKIKIHSTMQRSCSNRRTISVHKMSECDYSRTAGTVSASRPLRTGLTAVLPSWK